MQNRKVRMQKEVLQCKQMEGAVYVYAEPVGAGDLQLTMWDAIVVGPPDSPYQGGAFELKITLPTAFPIDSPSVSFVTKIFHPNIWCRSDERYGKICLDVLQDKWSPAFTLQKVLLCVQQLLGDPNPDAALDPFVADKHKTNPADFKQLAADWTKKYALPAASLQTLLQMGFGVAKSADALRKCDMNLERATNLVLGGGGDDGSAPSSGGATPMAASGTPTGGQPPGYAQEGAPLPTGWEAHKDPGSGRVYYYNRSSNTSTWERPR